MIILRIYYTQASWDPQYHSAYRRSTFKCFLACTKQHLLGCLLFKRSTEGCKHSPNMSAIPRDKFSLVLYQTYRKVPWILSWSEFEHIRAWQAGRKRDWAQIPPLMHYLQFEGFLKPTKVSGLKSLRVIKKSKINKQNKTRQNYKLCLWYSSIFLSMTGRKLSKVVLSFFLSYFSVSTQTHFKQVTVLKSK